jgi:hypothetical protein
MLRETLQRIVDWVAPYKHPDVDFPMGEVLCKHVQNLVANPKALQADLVRGLERMGEHEIYAWNYAYNERCSPIAWEAAKLDDACLSQAMQDAKWQKTSVAELRKLLKEASYLAQTVLGRYEA